MGRVRGERLPPSLWGLGFWLLCRGPFWEGAPVYRGLLDIGEDDLLGDAKERVLRRVGEVTKGQLTRERGKR